MNGFRDPKFLISLVVLGIFGWAFGENVTDDTMKGAIIGALNVVAGYWLGSSNSSNAVREQVGQALRIAEQQTSSPQDATRAAEAVAGAAQDKADEIGAKV